jgi:hypothetical protein
MTLKRILIKHVRGWFPQEPKLAYATRPSKPRWRRPAWLALSLIAILAIASAGYVGAQTFLRFSNPQADVTAGYYEKTLNCTSAVAGDVVEVNVKVYWHGHVLREFKRQVEIVDAFPQTFRLVGGNKTYPGSGYGGTYQFSYQNQPFTDGATVDNSAAPKLYLDNTEIPLRNLNPTT